MLHLFAELSSRIDLSTISHLALDATSGTVLLASSDGNPISPALMYNDNRATLEATEIQQIAPDNAAVHSASSGIAKILWLKRHYQPGRSARYLHQADWLNGQLTGNYGITDYNNALKTGADVNQLVWPDWITQLGILPQQLPVITKPSSPIATIKSSLAVQFGFSANLIVVTGSTDSTAAVLATGINKVGDAVSSLGSTLVVKIICDRAISNSKFGIYSQPFHGNYLVGGGSNTGGAVLKHFFTAKQMQQMSSLIHISNPNTRGLNYYPLLQNGERFPINDSDYPARLTPRPDNDVDFFQAMLEGIAEIEFLCYQQLEQIGCPTVNRVFTMGGGSQNTAWTQIRESRLQVPIIKPNNTEAAYGAALIAQLRGTIKQQKC